MQGVAQRRRLQPCNCTSAKRIKRYRPQPHVAQRNRLGIPLSCLQILLQ